MTDSRIARAVAGLVLACAALTAPDRAWSQTKSVAVTAIVDHPALNAVRDGVRDELKARGFEEGRNLRFEYESAQGNTGTAAQIARKFVGDRPDVIVPISTPSAQAVAAATKDIPIVFSAVTDPVAAKLVTSLERPGGNVTGVSDLSPIRKHLELVARVVPTAKRLGVVFNPGETNAVVLVELVRKHAPEFGMTVVEASAPRSSDVLAAARSLVGKVDAIYVPTDNTVVSAVEAVVKVGIDSKIPVFAGDTDTVKRGAIAAVGFNYYDVGRQTGQLVLRILEGAKPGDLPVQGVEITELHVNPEAAKRMGVTLPQAVLSEAKVVVQ
ncbi:MAG TPA: ABC transporter substrate-binding protein [Thermodesulfobacteriota bacterium]